MEGGCTPGSKLSGGSEALDGCSSSGELLEASPCWHLEPARAALAERPGDWAECRFALWLREVEDEAGLFLRTVLGAGVPPEEAAMEEWMLRVRGGRFGVWELVFKYS